MGRSSAALLARSRAASPGSHAEDLSPAVHPPRNTQPKSRQRIFKNPTCGNCTPQGTSTAARRITPGCGGTSLRGTSNSQRTSASAVCLEWTLAMPQTRRADAELTLAEPAGLPAPRAPRRTRERAGTPGCGTCEASGIHPNRACGEVTEDSLSSRAQPLRPLRRGPLCREAPGPPRPQRSREREERTRSRAAAMLQPAPRPPTAAVRSPLILLPALWRSQCGASVLPCICLCCLYPRKAFQDCHNTRSTSIHNMTQSQIGSTALTPDLMHPYAQTLRALCTPKKTKQPFQPHRAQSTPNDPQQTPQDEPKHRAHKPNNNRKHYPKCKSIQRNGHITALGCSWCLFRCSTWRNQVHLLPQLSDRNFPVIHHD